MLLYVLKAKETFRGIEEDVDSALAGDPDKFLKRLQFAPGLIDAQKSKTYILSYSHSFIFRRVRTFRTQHAGSSR